MSTSWSLAGPGSVSYHLSFACRGSDGPGSGPAAAGSAAHVRGFCSCSFEFGVRSGLGGHHTCTKDDDALGGRWGVGLWGRREPPDRFGLPGKFLGCQLDSSTEHVAPTPRDVVASVFELAQVQPRLWGVNRSAYRALGAWRQRRVDTAPHLTWWESTGFLGGQNPHLKG